MVHRTLLRFVSLITVFALSVTGYSPALAAPPSNDDFANAELITSLPFVATVDISEASIETDENQSLCTDVQRSVWYVFTPASTMMININMLGGSVSSALGGIYRMDGSGFNELGTYRCAYSTNPPISVRLDAGQTYYIQVASYTEEVGTIQLNLEQLPPPANDNFADATSIDSLPFSQTTPLQAAVFENGEPQPCNFMDRSVWYSFTPAQNMMVQADLQGSDFFNANVNVYRSVGTGITDLEFLTCSIFTVGIAVFSAEAGQTYYFQAGNAFGDVGTVTLNVKMLSIPVNDNFADATIISSLPFQTDFEITAAGIEADEREDCGTLAKTVWFRFTPEQDISVRITTDGTTISNRVGVFRATGAGMGGLEFLTCATSIFEASAGETYYIQAGTHTGWSGNIQLNLEQVFPPPNDAFAEATAIEALPFSATVDTTEAWFEPSEPNPCSSVVKTVWYSFTPTETMMVQVNTPNRISNGDNVNIYQSQGSTFADLTFIGCTTNVERFIFVAEAGQTYYLQAGSSIFEFAEPVQFDLVGLLPPSNDAFANAEEIFSLPFHSNSDVTAAGIELDEPAHCGTLAKSVWFRFAPAEDIPIRVNMEGTAVPNSAAVFRATGPGISDLEFLTCAPGIVEAKAGETYYIQAGLFEGWSGNIELDLEQLSPPANNAFADAQLIQSEPFSATVDISDAWTEPNEPQHCATLYKTVWYAFTPYETMSVRVRTPNGSSAGDSVSVYQSQGGGITDLAFIRCTNTGPSLSFVAEAGQTYYLQLGNINSSAPTVQFDLVRIFPPVNDNFANAGSIESLPFNTITEGLTDASTESGEQQYCYFMESTVWYSFTPTETMAVTASSEGSVPSSNINVFHDIGAGISGLNFINCTAANGPVTFVAEAGQTYYLQAGTISGETGVVQVNLEQVPPPANDNFAGAETLGSLPVDVSFEINGAGTEPGEPQNCSYTDKTAWYSFTSSEDISIYLSTQGTGFDHNIGIYRGTGSEISDLQFLTCTGSSGGIFQAQAGETYFLQAGAAFHALGTYQINLQQVFPTENDAFADAIAISALPFSATADLTNAFNEFGEPQFCISTPSTVWYSFTASETTRISINTDGSMLATNVNTYHASGSGFEGLQFISCNLGSTSSIPVTAGETYYFQVSSWYGEDGTAQLNLAEVPSILGRITDAVTGAPLPGDNIPFADVQLYRVCGDGCLDFVNRQAADGDGRFSFDSYHFGDPLPPGEYKIMASANLYANKEFGPFIFTNSRLDVGDLALDPPAVIRGRAVDAESGLPLPGASVSLYHCNGDDCSGYLMSQSTDGDGLFLFNNNSYGAPLSAGTYELEFMANQYEPKRVRVTIEASEDKDLGDVRLEPIGVIGSISGQVLDALTGRPIAEGIAVTVTLARCEQGCWVVNSMSTGADGRFHFENDEVGNKLLPGSYEVYVAADQYEPLRIDPIEVIENEHKDLGSVGLQSNPVRFSEVQACDFIPASGGECAFSVKISNGTTQWMIGRAWSIVEAELPGTLVAFTKFEARDGQFVSLRPGGSRTFRFKFDVPSSTSQDDSYICTRVFVGQGLINPVLNTVGYWNAFCIVRNGTGYEIASPEDVMRATQFTTALEATGTEIEPNNSCQSAQDVGEVTDAFVMDAALDSSEAPDIDYFRFSAAPGAVLSVDLEGQATGKGTLGDPLPGLFDSNCNLITLNDDSGSLNSRTEVTVPGDGIFVMAATTYPDSGFVGGGNGSYQLTLTPVKFIGSISGTVTDAVTGKILRGNVAPFTFIHISRCDSFGCFHINTIPASSNGTFRFEIDGNGTRLPVGDYSISVTADQYQPGETGQFAVGEDQHYAVGNIPLQSNPIRFSEVKPCDIPTQGGVCEFSVRVTNGLATKFSGKAWSLVSAVGMGSPLNFTEFQTDTWQDLSLNSGKSKVLRFRFLVRGSVDDGAVICATAFAGQKPSPFFNAVGRHDLFCFEKGEEGFTLMSPQQMQKTLHEMEVQNLPEAVIEKQK